MAGRDAASVGMSYCNCKPVVGKKRARSTPQRSVAYQPAPQLEDRNGKNQPCSEFCGSNYNVTTQALPLQVISSQANVPSKGDPEDPTGRILFYANLEIYILYTFTSIFGNFHFFT